METICTITTLVGLVSIRGEGDFIEEVSFASREKKNKGRVSSVVKDCRDQVREYFAGKRFVFSLPLKMRGTSFQQLVWKALQKIPYGEVVSYKELAQSINIPNAYRAVGNANGANPFSIIIPCHRVIATGGHIGGYGGGLVRKRALLRHELHYKSLQNNFNT